MYLIILCVNEIVMCYKLQIYKFSCNVKKNINNFNKIKMLQKLTAFRDNILLFSLGCYGLGFIQMISYYYVFNLPIVFYINFNDILLFALTTILPTILVLFIFEIVFMILILQLVNFILKKFKKNELSQLGIQNFTLWIVIVCLLFLILDVYWTILSPRYQYLMFISLSLIVTRNIDYNNLKDIVKNGILFILLIGIGIFVNCKNTLNGNTSTDVEFVYHEKYIRSGHFTGNLYIGETSSTIFMFNIFDSKSRVYIKENITDLMYSDRLKNEQALAKYVKFEKIEKIKNKPIELAINLKNEWYAIDKNTFYFKVEKNTKGIAMLMEELKDLLELHNLDYNYPFSDDSYLSKSLIEDFDYTIFNKDCKLGKYQIDKWWTNESHFVSLHLGKDQYYISYHIMNKNKTIKNNVDKED